MLMLQLFCFDPFCQEPNRISQGNFRKTEDKEMEEPDAGKILLFCCCCCLSVVVVRYSSWMSVSPQSWCLVRPEAMKRETDLLRVWQQQETVCERERFLTTNEMKAKSQSCYLFPWERSSRREAEKNLLYSPTNTASSILTAGIPASLFQQLHTFLLLYGALGESGPPPAAAWSIYQHMSSDKDLSGREKTKIT